MEEDLHKDPRPAYEDDGEGGILGASHLGLGAYRRQRHLLDAFRSWDVHYQGVHAAVPVAIDRVRG